MRVAKIVDTTAAGDSFNAGYLCGRLTGKDPGTAAAIGNQLAAIKIQHPGAIMARSAMPKLDAV
jgi:2-dehydro-3-deoxygluconokinase